MYVGFLCRYLSLSLAAGFAVAWIFQSAVKAAAYLTALFALAIVAAFVAWRHPHMSWTVAVSAAALYAMAVVGVTAWWLWHNRPR